MKDQLLNDIKTELNRLKSSSNVYKTRTAVHKIYEIYILSCVIKSLKILGCDLETRDSNDQPTSYFDFRLSPGYIYSPTVSSSFILISYNNNEYELHNGIRVLGQTNVLHELDVAIITRDEAMRCRQNNVQPRQSKIKFLAECKYYGAGLPLNLGREYLGLCSEFKVRVKSLISNVGSDNNHKLLTGHRQTENFNIEPSNPENVDMLIKWISNELRQVL
jgi:hypothetical protein